MNRPRVGYRFMPSDEEIITYFLKNKIDRNDSLVNDDVHEIDLYKHEPWDLPSLCANEESHDQTWYFFCKHEKDKSHQTRTTKVGFWKSTGRDRNVKNKAGKEIGKKKTLRFHIGRTRHGERTEWTIHEYSSSSSVLPHQTHFVLCKLMKNNAGKADASGCHEKPLGNPPSNNENGENVMPEVDQEQSLSPNFGDSLHPPKMPHNNFCHFEAAGLRSSGDLSDNELSLAVSLVNLPDEFSLSTAPDNAYHENIYESYADFHQGGCRELQGALIMQDGHAVSRPQQYQQRQSVSLRGTLPSLTDDNEWERTAVHRGEVSEEGNKSHQRRTTRAGYWKSTGPDQSIKNEAGEEIGRMKTLRFHEYSSSSSVLPYQNAGKDDASGCHEMSLGNPPSNNENGEIVMPEVDQEQSLSPNFGDSLHPPKMQLRALPEDPMTILKDGYLTGSSGLRSSGDFSEEDRRLADSFLNFPDELSPSAALDDAHHEHINESYADFAQAQGPSIIGSRLVGGKSKGRWIKSFSDSTTPGDYEIYANGQEFSESSSSSSTTPKQDIHFTGPEWSGSSCYSTKNRSIYRAIFESGPSDQSVPKIQKPVAVHLPQKKNSQDSGKMKRLVPESEKDQTTVVAAASSELRTTVSSFIRFETLPKLHGQNPPVVYIANVLVGLILFVVISRQMLIFH